MDNAQASSVKESQRADAALAEKAGAELEAADLRRQCIDLQQKASTLTVSNEADEYRLELCLAVGPSVDCPLSLWLPSKKTAFTIIGHPSVDIATESTMKCFLYLHYGTP